MIKAIRPPFRTLSLLTRYMRSHQTAFLLDSPEVAYYDDVSLSDVTHGHLMKEISGSLRQKYLVPYKNDSRTATGILFGPHGRPIVSLPVEPLGKRGELLSVHFLVDTAAPTSYLSEEALKALFSVSDLAYIESTNVNIWGVRLAVSPSVAHRQGVNLLGANYLRKASLTLECVYSQDPSSEHCILRKS
jgi:hypothetical protein